MVLVIDEDQLVARQGIGEADPARVAGAPFIGDLPHGAFRREFGVGQSE
jgi:hypothetical protein